ncbi:hypothetical protein VTJ49DRAFT_993 [Mycothermus thermophilus]|uniref:ribonuclease Z n=1 Tax=Humicola insolens TaxID=85995 RepID=A0ABR3VDJ7_HUMIN
MPSPAVEFACLSARLDCNPLIPSNKRPLFTQLFVYAASARSYRRAPSPLINVPRLSTPDVPRSLFPGALARPVRTNWNVQRPLALRYVLANASRTPEHPAITVLPNKPSMTSFVQVVSVPTADTPGACLLLHFDHRRYMLGRIAEGTQRNMVQRKVPLAKINDIFLTGTVDWDSEGGLLGMILTLADLKAASAADSELRNQQLRAKGKTPKEEAVPPRLNVHGGRNLVHYLATARRFILRKALPLYPREIRRDPRAASQDGPLEPDYVDENIRMWSIPLVADAASTQSSTSSPVGDDNTEQPPKRRKLSTEPDDLPEDDAAAPAEDFTADEADQAIREGVVRDMFNSTWKLDTLREMRLADVQLPAKIFIRNDQGHIEPYKGPPASECPDTRVLVRLPWPASKIEQLPATRPSRESMCYIVKCHSRRGKFDPKAAASYGIEKINFKRLTAGESVPGKDGVLVTPDMVMGPSIEGRGFAVVDLPSPALIDALLARREFSDPDVMSCVDTIFWILSENVTLDEPRLRQFIKDRPGARHLVLSTDLCPNTPALESPAAQIIKMNAVDKDRFHLPVFDMKPTTELPEDLRSIAAPAQVGWRYRLAPKPGSDESLVVPIMDTSKPIVELATSAPQVLALAEAARSEAADPVFLASAKKAQRDLPCPDAEIMPLGTGSAMPSKYRNVSATLIRVPGWGSYLLDCGENTLGQLRRAFGHAGADDVLRDLRAIYISHAHADHHLGTIRVIGRWRRVADPTSRIAIIATSKYQDFVRESHQIQDIAPQRLVPITLRPSDGRPTPGSIATPSPLTVADFDALSRLPTIEACFVEHCYEATAVVLTFPDTGLKIAYSGDCRPSAAFAALGRSTHLLIHECTFEDELQGDALAKKHSTLSEALDVGRRMGARRILLTHFSQRYPKLPLVDDKMKVGAAAAAVIEGSSNSAEGDAHAGAGAGDAAQAIPADETKADELDVDVLFAFDLMRVKLGEFKQAKKFLPALRELLQEEEKKADEDEGVEQ